jgi:hypothetical protein
MVMLAGSIRDQTGTTGIETEGYNAKSFEREDLFDVISFVCSKRVSSTISIRRAQTVFAG